MKKNSEFRALFQRTSLLKSHGKEWAETRFLPKFHPVMTGALLLTLVLIRMEILVWLPTGRPFP